MLILSHEEEEALFCVSGKEEFTGSFLAGKPQEEVAVTRKTSAVLLSEAFKIFSNEIQ